MSCCCRRPHPPSALVFRISYQNRPKAMCHLGLCVTVWFGPPSLTQKSNLIVFDAQQQIACPPPDKNSYHVRWVYETSQFITL